MRQDPRQGLMAIHDRHVQIKHHDVRLVRIGPEQGLNDVPAVPAGGDVQLAGEQTVQQVVLREEETEGRRHPPPSWRDGPPGHGSTGTPAVLITVNGRACVAVAAPRMLRAMTIWEPGSVRALASPADLRRIGNAVGQRFPATYLAVLDTHNAASFDRQDFMVVTPDGLEEKSVAVLLRADGDELDAESVLSQWMTLHGEHGLAPHVVPFAMDGGGNLVCFDFSANGEPAVVYWQHDEPWPPLRVAGSFAAFLHRLR